MEYNFLGRSGLKVSNICLGTMNFGSSEGYTDYFTNKRQLTEEQSHQIMDRYVELGGNFLDTANIYAFGKSEEIIGTWLQKQQRDKVVVATKTRQPMTRDNPLRVGLSRRNIIEDCEASLERLQTHYIDLFQAHLWDNGTPLDETLRTFDDLIRCGKIRYFGYSNVCGWMLQKIVQTSQQLNLNHCISLQQQYNMLTRHSEYEAFMVCKNEGIGVLPFCPLKRLNDPINPIIAHFGDIAICFMDLNEWYLHETDETAFVWSNSHHFACGLLTGKFERNITPDKDGSRIGLLHSRQVGPIRDARWEVYADDDTFWNLMEEVQNIAKSRGKSIPQVVLRWLLQKDVVSSVIVGVTSITQLEDNATASTGWTLSEEEMSKLDALSPREDLYPYNVIWTAGFHGYDRYNKFGNCAHI